LLQLWHSPLSLLCCLFGDWIRISTSSFRVDGVVESVHVENSSSKHFSAELSILTSSGGSITIHVSDRSRGWIRGQHLRVRYYGDTGELIHALFFDANGNEEGVANRTSSMTRALSVVLGLFLIGGALFAVQT